MMSRKKFSLAVLVAFLITGCEGDIRVSSEQSIQGNTDAAEWILKCAVAANPLSDEEGEDLVHGCAHTAKKIYGKTVYSVYKNGDQCIRFSYKESRECYVNLLKEHDDEL